MSRKFLRSRGDGDYNANGYTAQFMYQGESALVIGSTVEPGKSAPPHHRHDWSDQLYYVIEGTMSIQLGAEVHVVKPNSLVFIPRGLPHHNWNDGDVDEYHFEVLSPSPNVTQPVATPTDSTDSAGLRPIVRSLDEVGFTEAMPGFSIARLLQRSDGSENLSLYVGQTLPGSGGPGAHIHEFDQFYYILEGELTVEVAMQRFVAKPHDLVVLPAGVPHRQWNDGTVVERHLTLLAPEPMPGETWDRGVTVTANGDDH